MNVRKIIIGISFLSCAVAAYILFTNIGAEWLFWFFLYGVFAQMCLIIAVFTLGAFFSRKGSPKGAEMMRGAGISAVIIIIFWILAVIAMNVTRNS